MTANLEFQKVNEAAGLRGFTNLFHKEVRAWWSTRRWWINALFWPAMLGGLIGLVLFVFPPILELTNDPSIAEMGGPLPFALEIGRTLYYELGTMAMAMGAIILTQGLIVGEKDSGVCEWLLSKPVTRQSYLLSKLVVNLIAVLLTMIMVPSFLVYLLFSLRTGSLLPLLPFFSGVAVQAIHTFFYLTLTILLGAVFNGRIPILGVAFGSLMGGPIIGGFFKSLMYITPWPLAKIASGLAAGLELPPSLMITSLLASVGWMIAFVFLGIMRFRRVEF